MTDDDNTDTDIEELAARLNRVISVYNSEPYEHPHLGDGLKIELQDSTPLILQDVFAAIRQADYGVSEVYRDDERHERTTIYAYPLEVLEEMVEINEKQEHPASDLLDDDNPFELEHYLYLAKEGMHPVSYAILHGLYQSETAESIESIEETVGEEEQVRNHLDSMESKGMVSRKRVRGEGRLVWEYQIEEMGRNTHDILKHLLERERESAKHFQQMDEQS